MCGYLYAKVVHDDTAELIFPEPFREPGCLATKIPDPFTPEQHALDIINPIYLYMVHQKFFQYLKFLELVESCIYPG